MFCSPYANKVGEWCIQYYRKYQKAPLKNIQNLYDTWASDTRNKGLSETIADFLESLSFEYKSLKRDINPQYLIDLAGRYFNKVKLSKLAESILADLETNEVNKAMERLVKHTKVELGVGNWIDVLSDKEAIRSALDRTHEPLITYPGGLGKFFGPHLERDAFIAIQAPEKRGKSFVLQELAFRAVLQRRKVAFFECGDLSEHQVLSRFMTRIARHPARAGVVKIPKTIEYSDTPPKDGEPKEAFVSFIEKVFKEPLSWKMAYRACRQLSESRRLNSLWRLSCHYNSTLSVEGIRNILEDWSREDWIPDVIVIDYVDILNLEYPGLEGRDRIDRVWKQLRRLSQELHCLIITATQAAARAYSANIQTQEHFSEDKRKNAHVTGMIGLNQTAREKEMHILRWNWIDLREGFFSPRQCCYTAICPELANMAVKSIF